MFKKYKRRISFLEKEIQLLEENKETYSEHNYSILLELCSFELEHTKRELKNTKRLYAFISIIGLSLLCTFLSVFISEPNSTYVAVTGNALCIVAILVMSGQLKDINDEKMRNRFAALYAIPVTINLIVIIARFLGY